MRINKYEKMTANGAFICVMEKEYLYILCERTHDEVVNIDCARIEFSSQMPFSTASRNSRREKYEEISTIWQDQKIDYVNIHQKNPFYRTRPASRNGGNLLTLTKNKRARMHFINWTDH